MTYIPFHLKHRPKYLEDMIGQHAVVTQMRGMIKEGRIARSYIISGPYGSGKTTIGRMLAWYLNCMDFNTATFRPCGTCKSCLKMREDGKIIHPDIMEVNCSDNRKIDDIRGIIPMSSFKPSTKFRIFLMDEVHKLTEPAQNAFLKILEEPPDQAIFILCTTEPELLIDTIRSRCKLFKIKSVSTEDCVSLAKQVIAKEKITFTIPDDLLTNICKLAQNHPRDVLQALESVVNYVEGVGTLPDLDEQLPAIIDEILNLTPKEMVIKYLTTIYRGQYTGAMRVLNEMPVEYEYFVKGLLEYHTQAMFMLMQKDKLCDFAYKKFHAFIEQLISEHKLSHFTGPSAIAVTLPAMSWMMTELVQLQHMVKQYTVDGYYLLVAASAKFSTEFKTVMMRYMDATPKE